jgi:hypothetical protein
VRSTALAGLAVAAVVPYERERDHPRAGRHVYYLAAAPTHSTDVFVGDFDELADVRWVSLAEADELMKDYGGMFEPVHKYLAREFGKA